jgi:Holliday junction resolvase
MEIKKYYLQKYLHSIALEQIVEEYEQKGYKVSKEERFGNYRADITARKENETIVIEIKSGKMTTEKKEAIKGIGNFVRDQPNFKFLVVIATPPKEKKLEIGEIEELLTQFMQVDLPSELDELSTHTRLEEVTDVDIDEINIEGKSIFVKGGGVVNVELQFGSDGDQSRQDGFKTNENFPFNYEITLGYNENNELQITDIGKLEVDTSSFDE